MIRIIRGKRGRVAADHNISVTMTSIPLSSNSAASEHSSPRRSHRTHHTDVSNPHLQVLGRDGRDLPLFENHNPTTTTPPPNAAHPPSTKHWWNNVWNAHKEEEVTTYASLDAAEVEAVTTAAPFTSSLTTTTASTLSPLSAARALLTEPTTRTVSPTSDATSHYTNALSQQTEEDLIRQDCSFFYRDMDEVVASPRGHGTALKLPPQQQSAYRARYQQLNQDHVMAQDDLELYETEVEDAPQCPRMSDFSNSSLYYKQNGRVLMKLPKDKVRLVMDPELGEPGILSAIVNGKEDISYILTVHPDLYRKVVLDLSQTSCLWATQDRVSMRVAVLLLVGILLILFIFTLIYPGD